MDHFADIDPPSKEDQNNPLYYNKPNEQMIRVYVTLKTTNGENETGKKLILMTPTTHKVSMLKRLVEKEYADLFPNEPTFVCAKLQDEYGYSLSNSSFIYELLKNHARLFAIPEGFSFDLNDPQAMHLTNDPQELLFLLQSIQQSISLKMIDCRYENIENLEEVLSSILPLGFNTRSKMIIHHVAQVIKKVLETERLYIFDKDENTIVFNLLITILNFWIGDLIFQDHVLLTTVVDILDYLIKSVNISQKLKTPIIINSLMNASKLDMASAQTRSRIIRIISYLTKGDFINSYNPKPVINGQTIDARHRPGHNPYEKNQNQNAPKNNIRPSVNRPSSRNHFNNNQSNIPQNPQSYPSYNQNQNQDQYGNNRSQFNKSGHQFQQSGYNQNIQGMSQSRQMNNNSRGLNRSFQQNPNNYNNINNNNSNPYSKPPLEMAKQSNAFDINKATPGQFNASNQHKTREQDYQSYLSSNRPPQQGHPNKYEVKAYGAADMNKLNPQDVDISADINQAMMRDYVSLLIPESTQDMHIFAVSNLAPVIEQVIHYIMESAESYPLMLNLLEISLPYEFTSQQMKLLDSTAKNLNPDRAKQGLQQQLISRCLKAFSFQPSSFQPIIFELLQKHLQYGDYSVDVNQVMELIECGYDKLQMLGMKILTVISDPKKAKFTNYDIQFENYIKQLVDYTYDNNKTYEFINLTLQTLSNLALKDSLRSQINYHKGIEMFLAHLRNNSNLDGQRISAKALLNCSIGSRDIKMKIVGELQDEIKMMHRNEIDSIVHGYLQTLIVSKDNAKTVF